MTGTVNLYDNVYADFGSDAERAVRAEAYGEDLGQSSWRFLGCVETLSVERRLSRFAYLAEKPARGA